MEVTEICGYLWNTIEFTAATINSVASAVTIFFGCFIYFGKFIVDILSRLFLNTYDVIYSVGQAVTIMCEDFPYFLSDLENVLIFFQSQLKFLYESVTNFISSMFTIFVDTIYLVTYNIVSTKDIICDMYRNGLRTIYNSILTIKGALILIGNSIWMCIAFIPGVFLYLFSLFVFFINKCSEEISSILCSVIDILYLFFLEIHHFITDTPLESVCGLIVGFGIIYFMSKYKIIILQHVSQSFCKVSEQTQQYLKKLFSQLLYVSYRFSYMCKTFLINTKKCVLQLYSRKTYNAPNKLQITSSERLCVVCQDSETNIVIMPCNHMCLCEDCAQNEIFRPRRGSTCPVCRCDIKKTLKVYL